MTEGMALVRQECASFVANECIGMTTRGTLFRHPGRCYIAEGEHCEYYDQCLHPLTLRIKKARKKRWEKK